MGRLRKLVKKLVKMSVYDSTKSRRENMMRWFANSAKAIYFATMVVFVVIIGVSTSIINHVIWPSKPPKKDERKRA